MLECRNVGFSIPTPTKSVQWLLKNIDMDVKRGEFVSLVGPNGAGKSTLLKCISGILNPTLGSVHLNGTPTSRLSIDKLALERSVLTQRRADIMGPLTGAELTALGRYPHHKTSRRSDDEKIISASLQRTQAQSFSSRMVQTLSGGEASRVDFARVLAQQTPVILLDEPTNHLDPRHQMAAIQLCRELANDGHTVVAALHDLNLAALWSDRVAILADGKLVEMGHPSKILTSDLLEQVYHIPFDVWVRPGGRLGILPSATQSKSEHEPIQYSKQAGEENRFQSRVVTAEASN